VGGKSFYGGNVDTIELIYTYLLNKFQQVPAALLGKAIGIATTFLISWVAIRFREWRIQRRALSEKD
jgi:hypothetical protein